MGKESGEEKSNPGECIVRTPAHSEDVGSQCRCQHVFLASLVRLKICLVLRPVLVASECLCPHFCHTASVSSTC